ncbi:alpha/beta hydrolase [Gordonia sp. OPL2]|uniref:alpha/beta hydrolase n=1 Tax=Gordonia sp. OPL2 TaxID=2486274 RepID=UPI001655F160|nr:alpha/beta hydrolase [Gordonia sp. OPL2]ROZ98971.1 alpha/beta hydrolase [Gordonia sp. OPL2]
MARLARVIVTLVATLCAAAAALVSGHTGNAWAAGNHTVATSTLATTCDHRPTSVPVRWYIPTGNPTGLIWLQHGFARTADNLRVLASSYADSGLLVAATSLDSVSVSGCGVAFNATDNTDFIRSLALTFAQGHRPHSAVEQSLSAAARVSGRPAPRVPDSLVFSGHSAGGEFALTAADAVRTGDPSDYPRLRGLMLFDPVNSFLGNNFHNSARDLGKAGLPIRVIASQPSLSNTFGQGVRWIERTTRQDFLGVALTTGIHIDVEGDSTDLIGIASEFAAPRSRNGRVLRRLAAHWTADLFSGRRTAAYYPGGSYYTLLLSSDTVTTLPVR